MTRTSCLCLPVLCLLASALVCALLPDIALAQTRHTRPRPHASNPAAAETAETETPPATIVSLDTAGEIVDVPELDAPSSADGPLLLPVWIVPESQQVEQDAGEANAPSLQETPFLRRLRHALRFRPNHATVLTLEEHESIPPARISSEEISQWTATSQDALHQLSLGDYAAAQDSLRAVQGLSERAIEELSRETHRARDVLDSCLFLVRAYVESRSFSRAEEQALECRRLVPFVEPSWAFHPPEVRRVLNHADAQIDQSGHGSLVVRSEPTGCNVRLNGIQQGQSPYRLDHMPEGEYRVQVECDARRRGRVHTVLVRRDDIMLRVDTRFEAALRTRPFLALVYASPSERDQHVLADAFRIARGVEAREVVLAVIGAERVQLEHVRMPPTGNLPPTRAEGSTSVSVDADAAALEGALHVLEGGADLSQASAEATPSSPALPRWRLWTGIGLSALAAGAYAVAAQQAVLRQQRAHQAAQADFMDLDYLARIARWNDRRVPIRASASVASLLGIGASFMLARPGRPKWLTIPLLGVGGVLALAAPIALATRPACHGIAHDRADCLNRDRAVDIAFMLAGAGLPLVSAGVFGLLPAHVAAHGFAFGVVPSSDGLSLHLSLRL